MKKYLLINENGEEVDFKFLFSHTDAPLWKKIIKMEGVDSSPTTNLMTTMHKLKLAESDNSSDKGHFKLYPNGNLIFNLISEWIEEISTVEFEAMSVMTPFIYNWKNPEVLEQAKVFENDIYHINLPCKPDNDFVLRFNGDVGVFNLLSNVNLHQSQLPLRIYEMARSFRYTQNGKLSGLSQGRTFQLLDMHSFCSSLDTSLNEYLSLHEKSCQMMLSAEQNSYTLIKVPSAFYQIAKEMICKMAKISKRLILVEIITSQKQYWIMKHIIHNDTGQRVVHIQLDLENSKRYKISYSDKNGSKIHGPIVHTSLGSVERWMSIFLKDALNKKIPMLPLWISPIQIRILPVCDTNLEYCIQVAKELRSNFIRIDVDDRDISLNKKIKKAELSWIPYIIVCGNKEYENNTLSVRIRSSGESIIMTTTEIAKIIFKQNEGKPFRHQPNIMVSKSLYF